MTRKAGSTNQAPPPAGPYSQSVRVGGVVVCAGQGGATPDGVMLDGVAAQTEQCLANVLATLAASGATEQDIVKVNVYLTDVAHFGAMNEVYARTFSEPFPVRTTVYVTLPSDMLIEVDAIAMTGASS
ncbi:MAG: RidA family protein [Nocardioidaceae bacterium]